MYAGDGCVEEITMTRALIYAALFAAGFAAACVTFKSEQCVSWWSGYDFGYSVGETMGGMK